MWSACWERPDTENNSVSPANDSVQGWASAKVTDLRTIKIQAKGLGLYWPKLDADLYVPAQVKGIMGNRQWMAQIGTVGGKVTSVAKVAAARTNGKLGGRPRKFPEQESA